MVTLNEELSGNVAYSLGSLLFRKLGATTYGNLFEAGILERGRDFSDEYLRKKPDAIIYDSAGQLFAVIEEKADLSRPDKIDAAVEQNLAAVRSLTKLLIVTDNKDKTVYINTQAGGREREVFSPGRKPLPVVDVKELQRTVTDGSFGQAAKKIQEIAKNAAVSLSVNNNELLAPAILDPTGLAKTMWQKIFVVTGREPEKCLYNVVELFIFKLLSDLNVLQKPEDFASIFELSRRKDGTALRQYARMSRRSIKGLFPASAHDGTTLINGTIFVNENGEPNLTNASLFNDLTQQIHQYGEENGSFQHIQAEFKTRLFESFLRQCASVPRLGQFFTPRNVVQSIVRMSKVGDLTAGQRLLDPFCGVGGFVLEAIAESENIYREFVPKNGTIDPRITVEGWDRGSEEKDEQRTITLAKANMLIYLSDIIVEHHSQEILKSFADHGLSRTFKLIKEAGGTFSKEPEALYDVILTNPPYVRSGSKILKEQLRSFKPQWSGQGTEALALEWVVRALKPGGQAFVVVPDGLLRQHRFMLEVARSVSFEVVAKLPPSTFYSTPKVTYIIGVTKKYTQDSSAPVQKKPVLGFIVREIGETRDTKRWETASDLPLLESSFKLLAAGAKTEDIEIVSRGLGKRLDFDDIVQRESFDVDRTFWTLQEKQRVGIEEEAREGSPAEFARGLEELRGLVDDFLGSYPPKPDAGSGGDGGKRYRYVSLGDERYFNDFRIGRSVDVAALRHSSGEIPVFSSSQHCRPAGYISAQYAKEHTITVFEKCVKWNANGSVGNPSYISHPFSATADVGIFKVSDPRLNPDFVALQLAGRFQGFDWNNKAGIAKVKKMSVKIPVDGAGNFSRDIQDVMVRDAVAVKKMKRSLTERIVKLCSADVEVTVPFARSGTIRLADGKYFQHVGVKLGGSWSMKRLMDNETTAKDAVPVYTAAKDAPLRVARDLMPPHKIIPVAPGDAVFSFAADGDGSAGRNFVCHEEDFFVQANRVVVKILARDLELRYVVAQLATMRKAYGFSRAFKAKWDTVKKIPIMIPISSKGKLDTKAQHEWVVEYEKLQKIKESLWLWTQLYGVSSVSGMEKWAG